MAIGKRSFACGPLGKLWSLRSGEFTQDGIHKPGGEAVTGLLSQLDTFVDGGVCGNTIEKAQLKRAQAEGDRDLRIEFFSASGEDSQLVIEQDLPAKHTEDKCRGEMAISGREPVDRWGTEMIVCMRVAALDGQQNPKGGIACWRDDAHRGQPSRASAGRGFPRRNSSVVMRFLPSIWISRNSSQVFSAHAARRRWFSTTTQPGSAKPRPSA